MNYEIANKLQEQYMDAEGKWYDLKWHYVQYCILKSYLDKYEQTNNEKYYNFVKDFVDRLYDENGTIPEIDIDYYTIDQIRMASILFPLYKKEKDPKYKKVLDLLYNQLTTTYPRTESGSFWHKDNYPNQIWLDGLYMGQPFYVEYIKTFNDQKDYSDMLKQFANARKFIFNEETELYLHAYDESREMFWCDKETGLSPHVWGRAVGWLVMALVDLLEMLETEDVDTALLKDMLKETIDGMLKYQHSSGMWYQVVDMGDKKDNYLESSGTSMLAYAILKGVRLGYLSEDYKEYGVKAFEGTVNQCVKEVDGEVRLGCICRSAGLGRHPERGDVRDGSYEYYVSGEPIVENNGHGVAPFLMAYNEITLI
ncbi:unsaturated rhamnogalacturonyl hydrolase [Natranaerovirga hydrolytica]|uniref:Unsaturated rhamnogalacturonyl hydrolase n=1 Tax=Natranaerovirga hydrolytica TaxID=680378 RepID=A0A4R1MKJ4_9FIRM|nr:glycoside hydrolase family 88 protein [Natranaerovirga hydrolytica]TCK93246.1 unsaturated rhamnogalacturonyl hydrolase [Natranaerovirga hydrolytica]